MSPITPLTIKKEHESVLTEFLDRTTQEITKRFAAYENQANDLKVKADSLFGKDDTISKYRTAWLYRTSAAMIERLAESANGESKQIDCFDKAGLYYHFAGHAFRKQEEYQWAGESYMKSGHCFEREADLQVKLMMAKERIIGSYGNAIRAFRRAKGVFSEVGDYDLSGRAYYVEQRLISKKLWKDDRLGWFVHSFWGYLTGYGESFRRWFLAYLLGLFVFTVVYYFSGMGVLGALLLSAERSLLIAGGQGNLILLLGQTFYSYIVLGLGLTLIARRMQSR